MCVSVRGFYDCISVPLTSLIRNTLPSSSSCPPSSHLSPPASGCPRMTLINSKCKTHLSTAPLPPFFPSWGLGPSHSFLLSAVYAQTAVVYELGPNLPGPIAQAGLVRGWPQGYSKDLQRVSDAPGGAQICPSFLRSWQGCLGRLSRLCPAHL